jgi:hypothetical protein
MQLINIAGSSSKIIRPRSFAVIDKDPKVFKFSARHTAFVINKVAVTPFDVGWVMNLRLAVNSDAYNRKYTALCCVLVRVDVQQALAQGLSFNGDDVTSVGGFVN